MRKVFAVLGGLFIAFSVLQMPVVFAAAGTTIIPTVTSGDCEKTMNEVEKSYNETPDFLKEQDSSMINSIIACSIKTGRFHLYLVPYIIKYLAEFGIGIAGTVSMLFIVIGGLQYVTGPLTQNKEQGKKTVTYALVGLVLTLAAWVIVNVVQVFVTS